MTTPTDWPQSRRQHLRTTYSQPLSPRGPVVAAIGKNLIRRLSTTADSVAASGDLVKSLPPNSRVLDCACGTGQLAVGLASLGLDVVATDASLGMVRRTFNPEAEGYTVVAGRE